MKKRCPAATVFLAPSHRARPTKSAKKSADPLEMYRGDIYTVPVNIAGCPQSLPCGRGEGNLPIGAQFIGRRFDEATIYRAAAALEDAAGTADKILAGEGAQL